MLTPAALTQCSRLQRSLSAHACSAHSVLTPAPCPLPPAVYSFEDGLKLVKLRGESMQAAADAVQSGMVSVIGLNSDKVRQACCWLCLALELSALKTCCCMCGAEQANRPQCSSDMLRPDGACLAAEQGTQGKHCCKDPPCCTCAHALGVRCSFHPQRS